MGQRLGQVSPIPEHIGRSYDTALRSCWELKYVVWPKRCNISKRVLWPGTLAYQGTAVWHGPGEPVIEQRWHDRYEHLIWQLKE
jgi:hypothetical protein